MNVYDERSGQANSLCGKFLSILQSSDLAASDYHFFLHPKKFLATHPESEE
jgi:hypothetical protein